MALITRCVTLSASAPSTPTTMRPEPDCGSVPGVLTAGTPLNDDGAALCRWPGSAQELLSLSPFCSRTSSRSSAGSSLRAD